MSQTNNELQVTAGTDLIRHELQLTPEKIELIKSQICVGATDDELQLFLHNCRRTGLDPFARQIYSIKRWNSQLHKEVMSTQVSIDGFRVVAERGGNYAGQDEPEYNYDEAGKLECCKIRVYKWHGDHRYVAAVGVAYWSEYVQFDKKGNVTTMWKKMPRTMLAKCAEALALRKAYPQDLSGLYTAEEMAQADRPDVEPQDTPMQTFDTNNSQVATPDSAPEVVKAVPVTPEEQKPSDGRKELTNALFMKAMSRINSGERDILARLQENKYKMTEKQFDELSAAERRVNKKNEAAA